jgi:hypothetical protein
MMASYAFFVLILFLFLCVDVIASKYILSEWISCGWAFICWWILTDGMVVALDLKVAEKLVNELTVERNRAYANDRMSEEIHLMLKNNQAIIYQLNKKVEDLANALEICSRRRMGSTYSPPLPPVQSMSPPGM